MMNSRTDSNISKKTDIGKWFEKSVVLPALALLAKKTGLFYHRFLDTRAAGSHVPNAPADFYAMLNGMPILLECKASVHDMSLRSCLSNAVDPHQLGTHQLWVKAGGVSLFLFYSDQTRLIEFWRGESVVEARQRGGKLVPADKLGICPSEDLATYFKDRMAVIGSL
jgi:hypothetical protein